MPPTLNQAAQPALLGSLESFRRRIKMLSVLFGVGLVLAAAVGALLGVVLIDYWLNLRPIPRMVLLAVGVGFVGWVAWLRVVRPIMARLSIGDVAGHLENAFPQFDDRLRSTVDFVRGDIPGSERMQELTIRQADQMAAGVDFGSALARKPVLYSLAGGLAAIALLLGMTFGFRDFAGIAKNRLMGGNAKYPKNTEITVTRPLPAKIAAGQRLDVRMKVTKGDKASLKPVVFYKYDNGPVQQQIMSRNDDGTYSVAVDAKGSEKMTVWMKAGDDQTDPSSVIVVQRLAIVKVEAKVTPPPYSKVEPHTVNLSEAPAMLTYGSNVELSVIFNKPLADKPVVLEAVKEGQKLPEIEWDRKTQSVATGTWTALDSLRFRVKAIDSDYFENPGIEEYELSVKPDQLPTVMIENPRGPEDRTPVATVPLQAIADDDFAIETMHLIVDRVGDKKHQEIKLEGWAPIEASGDRRRFRINYEWELATALKDFNLQPGDVIEYYVRVTDNYLLDGKRHDPVSSGKLKLNIISQEQLAQQVTQALQQVSERVKQTQNAQNRSKEETANLRQDTEKKPKLDAGDRTAVARLADQESSMAAQTKQTANAVEELQKRLDQNKATDQGLKDIAKDVKQLLNDAAEQKMSEATQKLNQAAQTSDQQSGKPDDKQNQQQTEQRNQAMQQSEQKQQEASEQLGKALEKMRNLGTFDQLLQRTREALAKQEALSKQRDEQAKETLGKNKNELSKEQQEKLENLAQQQKKAAEETQKLQEDLDKAAKQSEKQDPATSQAMKQAAQQAQQQKVQQNQQQAAQSVQDNKQGDAQSRQKQAEIGLRMMLDTLREAERRKLEQLAKDLAKLQQLIAELIRRQAGHNVDNLLIQENPATIWQITDELLAKAERVRDKMPPKPTGAQLKDVQANTERRTRDYSKTAEELKTGGAEIAALMNKAAGFMERAVSIIRDGSLGEAYDPNQVKALATLEDAKAKTDKALQDIKDKQDEQTKEAIRQRYEKIREDQVVKVNTETARIDQVARLPDGSLPRAEGVKLGQLPGVQGKLADQVKAIEEDLAAVGGIVYVWANKDIEKSMNEVKADLAKPTTARPTQLEQKRIVTQLDAMIKMLAIKPAKKEFEQPPGGGGDQGGQPPKPQLPTEAEIRLLQALQKAINDATIDQSKLPKKEDKTLVALGGRQGELRGLLDQLLQKSSQGKLKLDAEPDPSDKLPEEADNSAIEDKELEDWLKNGKAGDDQLGDDMKLVGQRMARSRQRLALDLDPGKTTQLIQDKIILNLENLAQMARKQEAQAQPKPGPGQPGQQQPQPQPGQNQGQQQQQGQPQQNQGTTPAQSEQAGGAGNNAADLSKDIREKASEWGGLTPRERQAVIEGAHEKAIGKYEKITKDYYEQMGRKATQRE